VQIYTQYVAAKFKHRYKFAEAKILSVLLVLQFDSLLNTPALQMFSIMNVFARENAVNPAEEKIKEERD